jgi:hypothetical protein
MWHVQEYHITAQALEQRLGISSFETYTWCDGGCGGYWGMYDACLGIACRANF